MNKLGYNTEVAYNIALCYYKMKQLAPSLEHIAEIIEKGVREHPELGVGSNAEGTISKFLLSKINFKILIHHLCLHILRHRSKKCRKYLSPQRNSINRSIQFKSRH
jgi:hypothetical protein